MTRIIPLAILFITLVFPGIARADCIEPFGQSGTQIYNSTHNVMQYCNGTHWIGMAGGKDTLSGLSCAEGQIAYYDGSEWACTARFKLFSSGAIANDVSNATYDVWLQGNTSTTSGGDARNLALLGHTSSDLLFLNYQSEYSAGTTIGGPVAITGGGLDMNNQRIGELAAPTANTDAATKGYVDAAVASAGGGGGGASCYYVLNPGACGVGFVAMPGSMAFYSGGTASICCSGGGSSGDTTPDAFDFPDTPDLALNVGHTWTALQMTGFDSANVILHGSPTGVEYRTCADAACTNVLKNWKSTTDIISGGQYLQLRILATRGRGTITIMVGDLSDTVMVNKPWAVFVTNSTWKGNLGGVSGADAKCQSAAGGAGLTGTFRAWIADGNTSSAPLNRFENASTTLAFKLVNNTKVADNWNDLVDNSLDAGIGKDENGNNVASTYVWTNVSQNGDTYSSYHCDDWTNSNSSNSSYVGRPNYTNYTWYAYNTRICNNSYPLYCFQTAE